MIYVTHQKMKSKKKTDKYWVVRKYVFMYEKVVQFCRNLIYFSVYKDLSERLYDTKFYVS